MFAQKDYLTFFWESTTFFINSLMLHTHTDWNHAAMSVIYNTSFYFGSISHGEMLRTEKSEFLTWVETIENLLFPPLLQNETVPGSMILLPSDVLLKQIWSLL